MNLFLDARYTKVDGFHDGISRYSVELFNALLKLPEIVSGKVKATILICDDRQKKWFTQDDNKLNFLKIHSPTSPLEPFSALILNRLKPDVVFSPMQTIGSIGRKYKLILTLHDLIYYQHKSAPKQFNVLIRAGWWLFHCSYIPQRLILNMADTVATVSDTSKQEIIKAKLTKKPIIVTKNAPKDLSGQLNSTAKQPVRRTAKNLNQKPKNLIYMGSFMKYKNVEALIKGMAFLPNHTLHLLSRISPERQTQLESLISNDAKVVFYNGISDEKYLKLLSDRAILVSASLSEGYGLPVADAIAMGVPAVITDMPIFHEVAGEGALYFNPNDPSDFANKIISASKLTKYAELSKKGQLQSKKFSWIESAKILLKTADTLNSSKN